MNNYITRADKLIQEKNNIEIYSDISNSFIAHPISGKLLKVSNTEAVKQSVRNRIKTIFGEKLYNPEYGSNTLNALFEPNDNFMKETIEKSIQNSLQNDARINILEINIEKITDVSINIELIFSINNVSEPISVNILLKRVN